jgi:hypothetical protein
MLLLLLFEPHEFSLRDDIIVDIGMSVERCSSSTCRNISLGVHSSLDLFLFLPAEKVSCRFIFKPILATLLKRAVNQIPLQLVPSGFESTLPVLRVLFPCPSVNNCHMAL